MAEDTLKVKGQIFQNVGGIDESIPLTSKDDSFSINTNNGTFPFFYGMHERMFGKKIIDYNPGQSIYGICQTFNGTCLYGYYVQTNNKLYYHVCSAPPDLRIRFVRLQT